MVADGTVRQLWDDQAPEAPGVEFSPWRYCLELSQAGIAKQIGGAYATLVTIAFHANKQAHAWPSIPTLAREVGCTERGIMRDIKALEKYGALVIKKKPVDRGGVCNLYIVVPVIALLVKRPVTMRERLKVHGPDDVVTPDNIVRGDNIVASTPDNIVSHPLTESSPKRTKEQTTKNKPVAGGASAPRARKSPAQKPELDDETKVAARTFLDAFCRMWPTPRQADPGWWGEAVKAVQDYPLPDLLALVAYKKSRGRVSDAIRPKHVAADMDGWVAVGRPAGAERVRPSGQRDSRDSSVGMGSTSTERLGSQVVYCCLACGRVEGARHRTARGCPDTVVVRADCEVA